ncbi:MAG: hypothetical protein ACI9QC_000456 [Oceanicoccus sp.]|jgi:hypothetical protein
MKKLILLTLSALLLTSCGAAENEKGVSVMVEIEDLYFGPEYQADLASVDEGEAVGTATTNLSGTFTLIASFSDLAPLEEGFFYEGWLVRTEGELSVISTGAITDNMNFYVSEIDLSDHTKYILTLEPDDGDPAPADHVLEGSFTLTN